jgi:hypothetical protein
MAELPNMTEVGTALSEAIVANANAAAKTGVAGNSAAHANAALALAQAAELLHRTEFPPR